MDCDADVLKDLTSSVRQIEFNTGMMEHRLNEVEEVLQQRSDALKNIYAYMQHTDERLTKIETTTEAYGKIWGLALPFLVVVFTALLGLAGDLLLHVYGGH
jgi:hypothetical protein